MLRYLFIITIVIIFSLPIGIVSTAYSEECFPVSQDPGHVRYGVSGDYEMWLLSCHAPDPQSGIDFLSNELRLHEVYSSSSIPPATDICWMDGSAFSRLFNAAWMLHYVAMNKCGTWEWTAGECFDWLRDYIHPQEFHGFKINCGCDGRDSYSFNPSPDWCEWFGCESDPISLCYNFFWNLDVVSRASTLVHEVTHESSSHICNKSDLDNIIPLLRKDCCDYCSNCASCDDYFGHENANTKQIYFLSEAIKTYKRDHDINGDGALDYWDFTPPFVNFDYESGYIGTDNEGNRVCGLTPILSPALREMVALKIYDKLKRWFGTKDNGPADYSNSYPIWVRDCTFGSGDPWAYGGCKWWADGYAFNDSGRLFRWDCDKVCVISDYEYPYGKYACNEVFNQKNVDINQWYRDQCTAANAMVNDNSTQEERREWSEWFQNQLKLKSCEIAVDQNYLDQQCLSLITSATDVQELIDKWSDELEKYDRNNEAQINTCVSKFCQDKLLSDYAPAQHARDYYCYEWSDVNGCLDELCGSLSSYVKDSKEYFEAVYCREQFFNRDMNSFLSDFSLGYDWCAQEYRDCRLAGEYEVWLQAKQNDICSFTNQPISMANNTTLIPTAVPIPVFSLQPFKNIKLFNTYQDFQNSNPGVQIDECGAQFTLCREERKRWAEALAKFADKTNIPRILVEELAGIPTPPPINYFYYKDIDKYTKELARIAVSQPGENPVITPENALEQLVSVPEVMHSLSKILGRNTFFALLGTKGQEKIFGNDIAIRYSNADFLPDSNYTIEQRALLPEMREIKGVRELLYLPQTSAILKSAVQNLSQETIFNFLRSSSDVSTAAEFNLLIEGLAGQMQ